MRSLACAGSKGVWAAVRVRRVSFEAFTVAAPQTIVG